MSLEVIRKMGYENTYIYVFQYDITFQYFFSWQSEIYLDSITIKPNIFRRLGAFLKIVPLYTQFMKEQGEAIVMSGAMRSIDALKAKPLKAKRSESKSMLYKKTGDCMWQTTGGRYRCLTHNKFVEIEKNKTPKH